MEFPQLIILKVYDGVKMSKLYKGKGKTILFVLLLLTINFMRVIKLGGASFNMALSDVLLPFVLLALLLEVKGKKLSEIFYIWQWGIALILWLILVGALGILNPNIVAAGYKGIVGEVIKTAISLGYFYAGYNLLRYLSKGLIKRIWTINIFMFIGVGLIFIYIVKLEAYAKFFDSRYALFFMGTYTDPNHAATFLGINAFAFGNLALNEAKKINKTIYSFLGILSIIFIFLTDSRGGILAIGIAGMIFFVTNIKFWIRYPIEIVSIFTCALISIFMIDHKFNQNFWTSRLYYNFLYFDTGMSLRKSLFATALEMGKDNSIFGVGRGNYILNSQAYFEKLKLIHIEEIPHNTYVGLFAETGLIGVLLFVTPLLVLIYNFVKQMYNSEKKQTLNKIFIALLPIFIVIGVQSLVLNIENQRIIWLIIGIAIFYVNNNSSINVNFLNKSFEKENRMNYHRYCICFLAVLIMITIGRNFTYFNLYHTTVYNKLEFEIPISKKLKPQIYELSYHIILNQDHFEQEGIEMELQEVYSDGKIEIIKKIIYKPVYATENIQFEKKGQDSNVKIIFTNINPNLEKFRVKMLYIKSEETFRNLDRLYLLPFNDLFL